MSCIAGCNELMLNADMPTIQIMAGQTRKMTVCPVPLPSDLSLLIVILVFYTYFRSARYFVS